MIVWRGSGAISGTQTLNKTFCPPAQKPGSESVANYRPPAQAFRDPQPIALGRLPYAEAAKNFVAEITAQCLAVHGGGRGTGKGRVDIITRDVGLILGGLLRSHFGNHVVEAPGDYGAVLWLNASIRKYAFWGRIDMLEHAGFVGRVSAGRFLNEYGMACGRATKLWAMPDLIRIAAHHGITADTVEQYWRMSEAIEGEAGRPVVPYQYLALGPELTPEVLEGERSVVSRLNAAIAKANIRGCRGPVLQRKFPGADVRLGGAFYALGDDNFQSIRPVERAAITIDGAPVTEIIGLATLFSIFLSLAGESSEARFGGDLYAIDNIERDLVKSFVEQSLAEGRVADRWASHGAGASRLPSLERIRDAVLTVYPALAEIPAILPPELRFDPPRRGLHWAAAQFLIGVRSRAILRALDKLMDQGVIALPLQNSLLVATENERAALEAVTSAFGEMLTVPPRFELR